MKHVQNIQAFVKTLLLSDQFHALVVQSPPGWGKSTALDEALKSVTTPVVSAGSYATPLHVYNTIGQNPEALVIFDDCAGVFSDAKAMSILKSATWPTSASASSNMKRTISWGSTSNRVELDKIEFSGKLILLTNSLPAGLETEAFLSRCLNYRIQFSETEIRANLILAAKSTVHFENSERAFMVADYLQNLTDPFDLSRISIRTLRLGYDLASTHPESWRELLDHTLPKKQNFKLIPKIADPIESIFSSGLTVKEQEAQFMALTGKSRRTFYNFKKRVS